MLDQTVGVSSPMNVLCSPVASSVLQICLYGSIGSWSVRRSLMVSILYRITGGMLVWLRGHAFKEEVQERSVILSEWVANL